MPIAAAIKNKYLLTIIILSPSSIVKNPLGRDRQSVLSFPFFKTKVNRAFVSPCYSPFAYLSFLTKHLFQKTQCSPRIPVQNGLADILHNISPDFISAPIIPPCFTNDSITTSQSCNYLAVPVPVSPMEAFPVPAPAGSVHLHEGDTSGYRPS